MLYDIVILLNKNNDLLLYNSLIKLMYFICYGDKKNCWIFIMKENGLRIFYSIKKRKKRRRGEVAEYIDFQEF